VINNKPCAPKRPTIGIHGNSNAVVFSEISADGYFDHKGFGPTAHVSLAKQLKHGRQGRKENVFAAGKLRAAHAGTLASRHVCG
jgi:hypothetical protein